VPKSLVFAYGTLQIPAVMRLVVGRDFNSIPATLVGFKRLKIKNKTYPAVVRNEKCTIDGVIYSGIDDRSLELIDKFEDCCYQRTQINLVVEGKREKAFIYEIKDEYKNQLSDQAWCLEEFRKKYLKKYLKAISNF
jgi:gamma-glutamylcyclotransferase (GGCT)/AIG2-like uncharacterized protein YtfP